MTAKTRTLDFLFTLVVGILYAYALASACLAGTYLEYAESAMLFWCAVFTAAFCLIFFNKYTTAVCLTSLLVGLLAVYISLYRAEFQVAWFQGLRDYVYELLDFANQSLELQEGYSIVLGRAIALIFSLLTALNLQAGFHFLVLTFMGLGTIIYPIYMDWGVNPVAIMLFIFCMAVLLSKKLNLTASSLRRRDRRLNAGYSMAMIPLCALIVLAAWLLPKPASAPGGSGVQDFFFRSANRFVANITGDAIMIYSDDDEPLGGPISLSNYFVMQVRSDERVYLSGTIRDTYTGTSWTRQDSSTQSLGAGGILYAMPYSTWEFEQQKALMRELDLSFGTVEVHTGEYESGSLFSPPFRTYVEIADLDIAVTMDAYGALSTAEPLPNNTEYSQLYIAWNWKDEAMIDALRASDPQAQVTMYGERYENYLQLPDTLPQRVQALAWQLGQGHGNAYDQLKAIESYLREMPYTLLPGEVPDGVDFVDHFLFEEQQGYCVYYATAFAVMGRCLGIPTRYVEGFALSENRDDEGWQTVTNAQAHAWAEAYFPGVGWVPFEPTPPGHTSGETSSGEPQQEEEIDGMDLEEFEQMEEELQEEEASRPEREESSRPENDLGDEPGDDGAAEPHGLSAGLVLALLVLLAAGSVGLRVWQLRRRFARERSRARTERAAVLSYGSGILEMAERMHASPRPGETLHRFAERAAGEPPFVGPLEGIDEVAAVFGKAAFSVEEVSEEELALVETFHQQMLAALCATPRGKIRYLIHHYLLGSF